MPFKVLLTDRAKSDLRQAHNYISKFAPDAADRWHASILDALLKLEVHPEIRPIAPENSKFPFELHQLLIRTKTRLANRALFTIVGDEVRVLAIRRPGQPLISKKDIE